MDSKGTRNYWKGYKFQIDTADNGLPVAAILTSASVHDSAVAIPLEFLSAEQNN